jgi:SAM-dependent methyltransferase
VSDLKAEVRAYWDAEACGEVYAQGESDAERLGAQAAARYELEPYLPGFARFAEASGQVVLEVGVGMGADHFEFARHRPSALVGVDLTERALQWTKHRFEVAGTAAILANGDAEALPYRDDQFDLVYSWGVLHHSPDTARAIEEVHRVLRPGGRARIMIYHRYSVVGYVLWVRYGLVRGRPWRSLDDIYASHLESPGTKAFRAREARRMCRRFTSATVTVQPSFGDLLLGEVGARKGGPLLSLVRALWPRWLIRRLPGHGLMLMIEATK